ncbi:PQQ-dependent sugar dehydrogenase [Rhodovarius crocodyli]|uniref:PQQ-dependent sugar dehydrogenase n=1 Tax=Rhodovarius crocodyli TaxID=1979269 RepID=A0A437MDA0_9PROT|nr:PQQ-dependent sugar dehydrogenase [Rhodovarius crocodyli]RVT95618.1 PQQ-dependent sugar dehydrogenase [Rhodovarius crocodyli]
MSTRRALLLASPSLATVHRAHAQSVTIQTQAGRLRVSKWCGGLSHPWGAAFLPDGRMLVTEREGRLRLISPDGRAGPPISNLPPLEAAGQGGLLDVKLAADFASSRRIWLSTATLVAGGALTRLSSARLSADGTRLEDVTAVLDAAPAQSRGRIHYGGRIAVSPDGRHVFLTTGERNENRARAQSLSDLAGKVLRLTAEGRVPADNPFAGRAGARPEIWSYGHRNPQGIAFSPTTGSLFVAEFGPLGGDELNLIRPGLNYGWPVVSHGRNYDGTIISNRAEAPGMEPPLRAWVPAISPSGLAFGPMDGRITGWRGSAFMCCQNTPGLLRIAMQGDRPGAEERLLWNEHRVRLLVFNQEGSGHVLVDADEGMILRIEPI